MIDMYKKYPSILPGSIEKVPKGQTVSCGKNHQIKSKGVICIIKCIEAEFNPRCLKTRVINVQDVKQVTRCTACIKNKKRMSRKFKEDRDKLDEQNANANNIDSVARSATLPDPDFF